MAESSNVSVRGVDVDAQTRCAHWHSPLDIIAIKFKCCDDWYACYDCHAAVANHQAEPWPKSDFAHEAILCGACRSQLTINEYLSSESKCPNCGSAFNPKCANHYDLYFET